MTKRNKAMEFHEAAEIFPMFSENRLKELAENIKSEGLLNPIVTYENKILDGRNRYAACQLVDVTPEYVEFSGDNPWEWVWSLNGERRDLTDDVRYLIWKKKEDESGKWEKVQAAIREEANKKRSVATAKQPRSDDGRYLIWKKKEEKSGDGTMMSTGSSTNSANTGEKKNHEKGQTVKATASKTNRGAVARGDKLSKRPDLVEKVISGELTMTAGLREQKRDVLKDVVVEIPEDVFRIIYADPPWRYGNSGLDDYGHAEAHYPTLSIAEICAFPLPKIEDNAVLFMWATSPFLEDVFKVIKAWGFKYKTSFVWDKVRHNYGHYNSVRHEMLLVCTKGSCVPDKARLFDSVVEVEKTKKHSEKPEEFRKIIEEIYTHGNRLEVFGRKNVKGWSVMGNENG